MRATRSPGSASRRACSRLHAAGAAVCSPAVLLDGLGQARLDRGARRRRGVKYREFMQRSEFYARAAPRAHYPGVEFGAEPLEIELNFVQIEARGAALLLGGDCSQEHERSPRAAPRGEPPDAPPFSGAEGLSDARPHCPARNAPTLGRLGLGTRQRKPRPDELHPLRGASLAGRTSTGRYGMT